MFSFCLQQDVFQSSTQSLLSNLLVLDSYVVEDNSGECVDENMQTKELMGTTDVASEL